MKDTAILTAIEQEERNETSGFAPFVSTEITQLPSRTTTKDFIANEVPVCISYNGLSHVVMMASAENIEEFAIGFTLSEKIVPDISHIYDVEVQQSCDSGLVAEVEISPRCFAGLKDKRRTSLGRTGCGICGTERLDQVYLKLEPLPNDFKIAWKHFATGLAELDKQLSIGSRTGCTHSMVAVSTDGNVLGKMEDIGRHVALDKLLGLRAKKGWGGCAIFMSSRASFEMVQKAVACGVEVLCAVSAPTLKAMELAQQSNLTLCAFCRDAKANIYTHPERILC